MNDKPVVQPPLPPRGGTRHPGRKRYPAAVKLKAVRLHLEEGFSQALVCREMAIGSSSLAVGQRVTHPLAPGRHAWVHVAEGDVRLDGQSLSGGDAAAVSDEAALELIATGPTQVLVFDLC